MPAIELAIGRFRELTAYRDENRELQEQIETRKLVDRAKGKLMDEYGMREAEAFTFIQRRAMSERTRMRAIAERVLAGELAPESS